jgi:hypothetical protein
LHYTASGIITPIGLYFFHQVFPVRVLLIAGYVSVCRVSDLFCYTYVNALFSSFHVMAHLRITEQPLTIRII